MLPKNEWLAAWNRVITIISVDERLPVSSREFLTTYGLPALMVFEWRSSFEISFAPLQKPLTFYNAIIEWGDFYDKKLDSRWGSQLVIGEEEFCNGHASYCIHKQDGTVNRIDCELSNPESPVNSTIERFAMSLLAAKRWSSEQMARNAHWPEALSNLQRELITIDPYAFEGADCFWAGLIEEILADEPSFLEITDDPARSKPRF